MGQVSGRAGSLGTAIKAVAAALLIAAGFAFNLLSFDSFLFFGLPLVAGVVVAVFRTIRERRFTTAEQLATCLRIYMGGHLLWSCIRYWSTDMQPVIHHPLGGPFVASLVAIGALTVISFAVLPRVLVPRIGETGAVYLGLFCAALAYAGYGLASESWIFYAWMIPFTLGGVGGPTLNALMSHEVPPTEQGELQGATSSITSLTSVVAMWAMPALFAWFTGPTAPVHFPGAAFFAAALCEAGGLFLFVLSRRAHRRRAVS